MRRLALWTVAALGLGCLGLERPARPFDVPPRDTGDDAGREIDAPEGADGPDSRDDAPVDNGPSRIDAADVLGLDAADVLGLDGARDVVDAPTAPLDAADVIDVPRRDAPDVRGSDVVDGGPGDGRCASDSDCASYPGGSQCVGGRCRPCDPVDSSGCIPGSASPLCDPVTLRCVACLRDADCASSPNGTFCTPLGCRRCSESTGFPCDLVTPICDLAGNRCRDCFGDGECLSRPGPEDQCVSGDCRACDPADSSGCDEAGMSPICSAATLACRGCFSDRECEARAGSLDRCSGTGACVVAADASAPRDARD